MSTNVSPAGSFFARFPARTVLTTLLLLLCCFSVTAQSSDIRATRVFYTSDTAPVQVDWNPPFQDTNYTAVCTAETSFTDFLLPIIQLRSSNSILVSPTSRSGPIIGNPGFLDCIAIPDSSVSDIRHARTAGTASLIPPAPPLTIVWDAPFLTNYTAVCTVEQGPAPLLNLTEYSGGIVTVKPGYITVLQNLPNGILNCIAVPDSGSVSTTTPGCTAVYSAQDNIWASRVTVPTGSATQPVCWNPPLPTTNYPAVCTRQGGGADGAIAIVPGSEQLGSMQVFPEGAAIAHCIAVPMGCQVGVVRIGQCYGKPGHWGGEPYAYHTDPAGTICNWGCALTSLSMSLNNYGVAKIPVGFPVGPFDTDPGFLNTFMNSYLDYSQGDVLFGKTVNDVVAEEVAFLGNLYNLRFVDSPFASPSSTDDLELAVCHGNQKPGSATYQQSKDKPTPVVVEVTSQCSGNDYGHYVLVTGEQTDPNTGQKTFMIADPAGQGPNAGAVDCPYNPGRTVQTFSTLDGYLTLDGNQNPFKIRGWVSDPQGDMSQLYVTVGDSADLLLIDPGGSRAGFDSSLGSELRQIPNSSHPEDRIDGDETGEIGYTMHTVSVFQPVAGNYVVEVSGLKAGSFTLMLIPFASDRSYELQAALPGVAAAGSTSMFSLRYSPMPESTPNLVRIASFASATADITNSLQLGLIDNAGIANALSSKIRAAAAAVAEGEDDDAREVLKAFKHQVSAQTGKHITGVAPQVLQEDADSLISQLPKTAQ